MYLAEEAIVDWLRQRGLGPQRLLHDFGVEFDIIDGSVMLPSLLEIDDEVEASASLIAPGRCAVRLRVQRDGEPARVVLSGKFRYRFMPLAGAVLPPEIAALQPPGEPPAPTPSLLALPDPAGRLRAKAPAAHYWSWRARYFLCHGSDRLQYSAHVRALEEVVDRFLAARGISIRTMLVDRGLIPVVSRVSVAASATVGMEEEVHTTFVVEDILRDTAFDGRMDSYVRRDDRLELAATARILHGYAFARGPQAGTLATLDADMIRALTTPEAS
jgi:hypothetical protein